MIELKLAKCGYGGGDIHVLQRWTAREVIQTLYYEAFLGDYEEKYLELNK